MSRWLSIAGIISSVAMLASCNSATMSLDQAKQITTELRGTGFTPPPRTIDDITAILDREKPDPAKAAANQKAANSKPPAGLSKSSLAAFYYHRADAAAEIGRLVQRRDDLREAVRLAREANSQLLNIYIRELSGAEFTAGDVRAAIELQKQRLASLPDRRRTFFVEAALAGAYSSLGDLRTAHDWLSRAEEQFQSDQGQLMGGNPRGATPYLLLDNERENLLVARARVLEAAGDIRGSQQTNEEALRLVESSLIPREAELQRLDTYPLGAFARRRENILQAIAKNEQQSGHLIEAEATQRRALLLVISALGKYAPETARAALALASIIYEQGRYPEAEQLARAALEIYQAVGVGKDSLAFCMAQSLIASAELGERKWNQALATYDGLKVAISSDPFLYSRYIAGDLDYAIALLHAGDPATALPIIRQAISDDAKIAGKSPRNSAEARAWLAIALSKTGAAVQAANEFRASIPALLAPLQQQDRSLNVNTPAHDQRLQLIAEAYMAALSDARGSAAAGEAFQLADVARGRSVQRALADSSARAAAADPRLADLARREQDAQIQRRALQQTLTEALSLPDGQRDDTALTSLRSQIESLRSAGKAIRAEIERQFPNYVKLTNPPPTTVNEARAALNPGETLIATYVGEERTFVWAVPKVGPVRFASVPLGHAQIKAMVKTLRKALDPNATTLEEVPPYDVKTAYDLYQALLKPVEAGWKDAKTLLVVAQGPLAQIPFEVLVTEPYQVPAVKPGEALFSNYKDVPWLAKKVAIAWLPSVTALTSLRNVPAPPKNRLAFAGFGDPWFNQREEQQAEREGTTVLASADAMVGRGLRLERRSVPPNSLPASYVLSQLPRLPDTVTEVRSIGAALDADPQRDIFLGARASEHRVETMDLSNRRVLLFATHGLTAGELNGLNEPALALTSPSISKDGGDGLLTLSEIMALRLNADWVVLSACNTAAGDGAGAEAVSGLGRGFFYAGARALLVTHWPVETTSAEMETVELFRRQAQDPKLTRAEALQQAKLAVIKAGYVDKATGRLAFSYAHPMFWAPYALVGDPGS